MLTKFRIAIQGFDGKRPGAFRNVVVHNVSEGSIDDVKKRILGLFELELKIYEKHGDLINKYNKLNYLTLPVTKSMKIKDLIAYKKPLTLNNLVKFCGLNKGEAELFIEKNAKFINKYGVFI